LSRVDRNERGRSKPKTQSLAENEILRLNEKDGQNPGWKRDAD